MPLVPVIWSMIAGCCLAVAAVQLASWMRSRSQTAMLAFGALALSVTVDALFELALMHAETPAQYGQIQRWLHVPLFVTIVSMLVFVRVYFGAGRIWLAYTIGALRIAGLALNFYFEPNIEFRTITALTKINVLGEPASVAVGTRNPWAAILALSSYLLIVYVLDATVSLWRRGDSQARRRALVTGGSLLASLVITVVNVALIRMGDFPSVYAYSVPFALLLTAIASEISADLARSALLAGRLLESESALQSARGRMEQATRAAGIGIWEWKDEGDDIWLNDSGRAFFGYAPDERVTFARFLEKLHDDDRNYVREAVMRSRREGGNFDREYRVHAAAGLRWIHTRGSAELDAKGGTVLMRGVFFDVSARREAADRFRLVVEAAGNGLVMLDSAGRVTLVNAAMQRIFGYARDELKGRPFRELLPQGFQKVDPRRRIKADIGGSAGETIEVTGRRRDGSHVELEIATTPIRTCDGTEALVSIVDISDRKRRDALLRKERAFLRQVIDIDPNLIFAKDREGRFTLANQAVADIYGTSVDDLIGRTDADFDANSVEVDAFRLADLEVMESKRERFIAEERVTDCEGRVHFLQTVKRPIIDEDGVARQVLGVSTDITARRQSELELDRQRNELAHLARVLLLSELSGSIAHELNQPLAAIMSNAEAARALLRRDPPELEEVREILDDIVSDDWRAAQIIAGMRALLRKGDARREPIDMATLVQDVLRLMHSDAINAGVRLTTLVPPGLPSVRGDAVQLRQVVLNLAMNGCDAMLANASGDRELTIAARDLDGGVEVSVSDTGPGMSAEDVERAFEPFFTTKSHGLGLGLAICRSIVGAHGGQLYATRNPGRGMTFAFTVPEGEEGSGENGTKGQLLEPAQAR